MSLTATDMQSIKSIVKEVIAEDVMPRFQKLETKIDRNHTLNIHYHLETRKLLADHIQKYDRFREDIARAATATVQQ